MVRISMRRRILLPIIPPGRLVLLFLFQFLKYFPGHWEMLGAILTGYRYDFGVPHAHHW